MTSASPYMDIRDYTFVMADIGRQGEQPNFDAHRMNNSDVRAAVGEADLDGEGRQPDHRADRHSVAHTPFRRDVTTQRCLFRGVESTVQVENSPIGALPVGSCIL